MSRLHELRQLSWVRLLLFWREPEAIFWVFLFPVVLALVLGLAFKRGGGETTTVGVVVGSLDDRWEQALVAEEAIEVRRFDRSEAALRKLRSGAVAALVAGSQEVTLRLDPTRPEGETARLRIVRAVQEAAGRTDPVPTLVEPMTENGSRYIDFLVPGLLGMNLMGTGIWGTGFAIVDMRQKKLLKRFLVTPMRKSSFLLAQMISRLSFLVAEVVIITLFGVLVLGVPFRSSILGFAIVCLLGAMCFAGLGLLTASRAQTIEGVSGIMNFVMMPMWLLSGVFFSYEKFPEALHPAIQALPLTALNDALRGMMLEGESLTALAPELGVGLAWTTAAFALALRFFRWK